jgi:SAM-dependent methyltransferase
MASTEIRKRLYERYVSTHAGDGIRLTSASVRSRFRAFANYYGDFLPADKDASILDIGCGHGAFLCFHRERGYHNAAGVDISPEQVAIARRIGLQDVECIDAFQALSVRPGTVAMVSALDFLEHLEKEEAMRALDAIHCALAPGGTVLIHTVNAESPFFGNVRYGDLTHESAFTHESLKQILSATCFDDIRIRPAGPIVHGILSLMRAVIWRASENLFRLAAAAETGELRDHIFTRNLIAAARRA